MSNMANADSQKIAIKHDYEWWFDSRALVSQCYRTNNSQ